MPLLESHVRDYAPNTYVLQHGGVITPVKTLADRLKAARALAKLSQPELAKMAGVSQGTIGNLEAGIRHSARRLPSIAAALGVSALWLAEGVGRRELSAAHAEPPLPPRDFSDRHEVDETDWGTLQAVKVLFTPEEMVDLRRRAKAAQERVLAVIATTSGPVSGGKEPK